MKLVGAISSLKLRSWLTPTTDGVSTGALPLRAIHTRIQYRKSFLYSIPVSIVLALELAIAGASARQIALNTIVVIAPSLATELPESQNLPISKLKQSNPPPPPDNPDSSAAGGRRDPTSCPQDAIAPKLIRY